MDVKELGKLKENVEEALRKIIAKGENISAAELENAQKALCVIDAINMMEQGDMMGEYSGRAYHRMSNGMYPMGGGASYRYSNERDMSQDGGSYRRGSRNSYGGNGSYNGGSYENGYSGHDLRGRMLDVMERMRDEAHNDHERQMMSEWIQRVASTY